MNVSDQVVVGNQAVNVVSLFGSTKIQEELPDPLSELLLEADVAEVDDEPMQVQRRHLVTSAQFPDQSMFVLEQQLSSLKESVGRIKFYLSDLDDLLPR